MLTARAEGSSSEPEVCTLGLIGSRVKSSMTYTSPTVTKFLLTMFVGTLLWDVIEAEEEYSASIRLIANDYHNSETYSHEPVRGTEPEDELTQLPEHSNVYLLRYLVASSTSV